MRIRKVLEPFKQLSGQAVTCLSIGEAIAEHTAPKIAVSLDKRRQQKALESARLRAVGQSQ